MGATIREARSAEAWNLALRQHGVLARSDLLALGFSAKAIKHRVARGRLHPVSTGVYAVGRSELTPEGRWMAAVLACGRDAALCCSSAAALWGIGKEKRGSIEVVIRRKSGLRRHGVRVRVCAALREVDVTEHRRIPVTTPIRTLIDLATEATPRQRERLVNEADKRDLVDPEALRAALDERVGEPGVRALRTLLDRHTFRLSDTELEVLFRPIAAAAGLPVPLTKEWVNGFEVDFHWPDLRLVIETDGLRYHRTPSAQARDALRDQTHTAAGFTRLRFTHHQVKYEPAHVRSVLTRTAARLRANDRLSPAPPRG